MHIAKIKLKKDNIFPEMDIVCSNINIFVGDQGTGKSTLLKRIKNQEVDMIPTDTGKEANIYMFDSEQHNPRMRSMDDFVLPNGMSTGMGVGGALASYYQSHGEVMEVELFGLLSAVKDGIILLDEPESGLSIKNQIKLVNILDKTSQRNNQIFLATHSYILIEKALQVLSFDDFTFQTGKDYIKNIK